MNFELAERVKTLTPSSTLFITAKAKELQSKGLDVIGLGAGEPEFQTPSYILEAANKSMEEGKTKYTPSAGLPALKQAIKKKMLKNQSLIYELNEIIVTNGAKHALYMLFQVLLNKEDEVIIPAPYWVSYPEQVKLASGIPVYIYPTTNDYKVTAKQIREAITPKTKAIIINSPSNPSGMVYTKEELQEIGQVCLENNIWIISDEIYEKLIYSDQPFVSIAEISSELKERTIIINGFSKSHAMTGFRIGYAIGNKEIINAMSDLASHSTSNPTTTAQYAAIAAYEIESNFTINMRDSYSTRLRIVVQKLNEIPGFTCLKPQGAFYCLPDISNCLQMLNINNVDEFSERLLEEALVAVVPGSGFGAPNCIRISYAVEIEKLLEAIHRIHQFVLMNMVVQQAGE